MSGLLPESFERIDVPGARCRLSVLLGGNPDGEPLVLLHGMRDHAAMFACLAEHLPSHRLILPDLRGHGDSDNPGSYSAVEMVADLVAVQRHFNLTRFQLAGHSLGGHIVSRFAVFYPDAVSRLVMLDGMGPPLLPGASLEQGLVYRKESWRNTIDQLLLPGGLSRTMRDRQDAFDRFKRANPGLSDEQVQLFVDTDTSVADDGVRWKFDSGLEMFWTGTSTIEHEASLGSIECPVLVVTGDRGLDYWTTFMPELIGQTALYQSELERRVGLFKDATSVVIPDAGHMLHYDQPAQLATALHRFLL